MNASRETGASDLPTSENRTERTPWQKSKRKTRGGLRPYSASASELLCSSRRIRDSSAIDRQNPRCARRQARRLLRRPRRHERAVSSFRRRRACPAQAVHRQGGGDADLLAWIEAHAKFKRQPWEIAAWSDFQSRRPVDSDAETLEDFAGSMRRLHPAREDIKTRFDFLDLDDHCSFGGRA